MSITFIIQETIWTIGKVKNTIRVMVMGRTSSGMREVSDAILGSTVPLSQEGIRVGSVIWQSVEIIVVESPVIKLDDVDEAEMEAKKLLETVRLLSPGPHMFLYVLDSTTKEDTRRAEAVIALLGENAHKHFAFITWLYDDSAVDRMGLFKSKRY